MAQDFLRDLAAAGVHRYHHNVETAASFFPEIATAHTYQERLGTIRQAQAAGLAVCVGGIFGLGESVAQRYEMAQTIKDLEVDSIPLNFLQPIPGTPLEKRELLQPLEALQIILAFRLFFPRQTNHYCRGPGWSLAFPGAIDVRGRGRRPDDRGLSHHQGPVASPGPADAGGFGPAPGPGGRMNGAWPDIPRARGVFVTGTDTDVGKTVVAAGLTAALRSQSIRATYFKPVQSGCQEENGQLLASDARLAQTMAGLAEPLEVLTPVVLKLPLAPAVAAAQAGVRIDLEDIAKAYRDLAGRYDFLVVEGAGGLYVPLVDNDFLVLDLARWLGLPVVVVARPGLGTINHTVMTVKAAGAGRSAGGGDHYQPIPGTPEFGGPHQSGNY